MRWFLPILVVVTLSAACAHGTPPPGTYPQPVQNAWTAGELIQDLTALSQTAINLNHTTGKLHLSDANTTTVRDITEAIGAALNAWGSGTTTLGALKTGLDTIPFTSASAANALRAAVDAGITAHGAGASVLQLVSDVFHAFDAAPAIQALEQTNPQFAAVMGAVRGGIASMPLQ